MTFFSHVRLIVLLVNALMLLAESSVVSGARNSVWTTAFKALTPAKINTHPLSITWGPTIQISDDTLWADNLFIHSAGDTVHMFWDVLEDGLDRVRYVRSTDRGTTFSGTMQIIESTADAGPVTPQNFDLAAFENNLYISANVYEDDSTSSSLDVYPAIMRTTNAGETWEPFKRIDACPTPCNNPASYSGFAVFNSHVYQLSEAAELTVFHSGDFGETWENRGILDNTRYGRLYADAVGAHYAGMFGRLEYARSTDSGSSWGYRMVLADVPDFEPADLPAIGGDGDGRLYIAWRDNVYGSLCYDIAGSIFLGSSTDNGDTWSQVQTISEVAAGYSPALAVDGPIVVVAWDECVPPDSSDGRTVLRISLDNGVTWSDTLVVNDHGNDIMVDVSDSTIHCYWWDRPFISGPAQVYYRNGRISQVTGISEGGVASAPRSFALQQNHPNPFNPNTTIGYDLPYSIHVNISVYSIFGEKISTLVDGFQGFGSHHVEWDAGEYASGVYYCILTTDRFVGTRKLILLK